jgi:hypothetical protein
MTTAISLWLVGVAALAWYGLGRVDRQRWERVPGPTSSVRPFVLGVLFAFTSVVHAGMGVSREAAARDADRIQARAPALPDEMRAIGRSGPSMALYRFGMQDPAPAPARASVLLLHGVLCNAGAMRDLRADPSRARSVQSTQ